MRQSETLKYLYLLFEDDSVLPLSSRCSLSRALYHKLTDASHRICLQHGGMPLLAFFHNRVALTKLSSQAHPFPIIYPTRHAAF